MARVARVRHLSEPRNAYEALLARERAFGPRANRGLLLALEAGEPVEVPTYRVYTYLPQQLTTYEVLVTVDGAIHPIGERP